MKLIREVYEEEFNVITEAAADGKKTYVIEGNFMQGDIKNRNGRVYPSSILEKEMIRYTDSFIKNKRALGELGHPDGPQINADRVSHLITEMKRDGNNFIGKAKILGTPMGEIVKNFIDEGVRLGVSTRGLGSVKQNRSGIMEVQNDFHLATVDIVTDPSGPDCFVNGIMENTEYYFDIASSSWKVASGDMVAESTDTGFVSVEQYNEAMDKIQMLADTINEIKKSFKPSVKKIDEGKAVEILQRYLSTLKN